MKYLSKLIILLIFIASTISANAKIDLKFYNKAADCVWGMPLKQFRADILLSDSIYENMSAVYIAKYIGIEAIHDQSPNAAKFKLTKVANSNAVKLNRIERTMVKLHDASAVEEYSEFHIDVSKKKTLKGFTLLEVKPAFGARVTKSDGTMYNIDMNQALTVTTGKSDKESSYKIAIPGLEPGDVLDYFYYTEIFIEESSPSSIILSLMGAYPTKNLEIDIKSSPDLALEYKNYNGAPTLRQEANIDGLNHIRLVMENIDAIGEYVPYISAARQIPYLDINILNNTGRLQFIPGSARGGGVRIPTYTHFLRDLVSYIKFTKIDNKILKDSESTINKWIKDNPQASQEEITDAAFTALLYNAAISETEISGRQFSALFVELLSKTPAYQGSIGAVTSRKKAPITQLASYRDADYLVAAGNNFYIPQNNLIYAPHEIPGGYDREKTVVFAGGINNRNMSIDPAHRALPSSTPNNNQMTSNISCEIDPTNLNDLLISDSCYMSGTTKIMAIDVISFKKIIADMATFLGCKVPSKIFKKDEIETIKEQDENIIKLAQHLWANNDATVNTYSIISSGNTPKDRTTKLLISGKIPSAVSTAGMNTIINIGTLIGRHQKMEGSIRTRDISIIKPSATSTKWNITLKVPEGYTVAPGNLENMSRNIATPEASFSVTATYENNIINIAVSEQYTKSIYPASSWKNLLKIIDSATEFNTASIVLKPKN